MPGYANLVHETATTTGTGNFTVAAVNGKQRLSTAFGTGTTTNVFDYYISNRAAAEYERGTGHMSDANTLVRDTVIESTNANAAVNFSAGTKDVTNDQPAASRRELLKAARTYYVRSDGSDSNTGLADSAGGAFLTWQKAYDVICQTLDTGGYTVTIKHGEETGVKTFAPASGTPVIAFDKIWTGGGVIQVHGSAGDITTPSDLVFSSTETSALYVTAALPNNVEVKGMKFTSSGSWGNAIEHYGTGSVSFTGVEFGDQVFAYCLASGAGSKINWSGNLTLTGDAYAAIQLDGLGYFYAGGITVTLTGTPAYSGYFAEATNLSSLNFQSTTFSGSATGARYHATLNGVIQTYAGGATYLPGDSAGSTATGGQYA